MAITDEKISKESSSDEDKKIHEEAMARVALHEQADAEQRALEIDDLNFSAGEQWPEAIKSDRTLEGRPCLVVNKLNQAVNQVTNDQRQNRPAIRVHPVDDNADIETAKVMQGLIRNIEYSSNADVAYDTAFDSAARCGRGYWRVITDYLSPNSFDQEIKIKRVRDRFSVRLDPAHQEPDGSDANWGFVEEWISKEEYKRSYGDSELGKGDESDWGLNQTSKPTWVTQDSCRVVEYFYKQYDKKTICLLNDGSSVEKDKLPEESHELIVNEREALIPSIKWVKLNAIEILSKTDWPGKYIPIVPVYGSELEINGKLVIKGLVRDAKDPQRMYNYWKSAETEAIALAPKAPFIAAEGQLEGYESDWASANKKNHAYLIYKQTDVRGQQAPPPQRQAFEPAVQAITQASMMASDDLKATTGIYDAALGARSNETSGVAINSRKAQGQTSSFHFVDNLTRSIRHTGKIIIDLIPHIYDAARTERIIGDDGEHKPVKLNQEFNDDGGIAKYDLGVGKYDVTADAGPSYQTKRQEAVAGMIELARAYPPLMQTAGDLMVRNMDWPGAIDIADRIKKTLPQNLLDDKKDKQELPPQVQQQMGQMNQMIEQLTERVHSLQDEKEQKLIEIESKERIEFKKLEVQLEIKRAELDAKDSHALLSLEIDQINQRLNYLNMNEPIHFESDEPQEQNLPPQNPDGAQGAGPGPGEQQPIGGLSPSQPLEGYSNEEQ